MSDKTLPYDVSRCNNHRCWIRTKCLRYMAMASDVNEIPEMRAIIPVQRFEPNNDKQCKHKLPINP